MSDQRTVFVTGATGQQGGAVINALLDRGHAVIGLTRNPESEKAKALAARGVKVVAGDFANPGSFLEAARGADTAYAMSTPFEVGPDDEAKQGIALVNALKAAGIGHIVLGSVADADKATGIPHFDSKFEVEKHLAGLGIPYTIVAPVYFMDNLLSPWGLPALQLGKFAAAMPPDRALQQIAVSDIGAFAAAVIARRESVYGKRFDIAGDELSGTDLAAILSKASGRPIEYEGFPPDALREQSEDLAKMFQWFDAVGYSADIKGLRRDFPDITWLTFEQWAARQDWSVLSAKAA